MEAGADVVARVGMEAVGGAMVGAAEVAVVVAWVCAGGRGLHGSVASAPGLAARAAETLAAERASAAELAAKAAQEQKGRREATHPSQRRRQEQPR